MVYIQHLHDGREVGKSWGSGSSECDGRRGWGLLQNVSAHEGPEQRGTSRREARLMQQVLTLDLARQRRDWTHQGKHPRAGTKHITAKRQSQLPCVVDVLNPISERRKWPPREVQ